MKNHFKTRLNCFWMTLFLTGACSASTMMAQEPTKTSTDHINRKWLDIAYATTSAAQINDCKGSHSPGQGEY